MKRWRKYKMAKRRILLDQDLNNFDLIVALKTMQGRPSPQSQGDFINHMIHSRFLTPAVLDPEPEQSEKGELILSPGTKILFRAVSNAEKKAFLIAFTDAKEAEKNRMEKEGEITHTVVTTYLDFCNIILNEHSPYSGFVINPFSENVIVTREIMQDINRNIKVRQVPLNNGKKTAPGDGN